LEHSDNSDFSSTLLPQWIGIVATGMFLRRCFIAEMLPSVFGILYVMPLGLNRNHLQQVTKLHNGNCHLFKLGKAYSPISKRCLSEDETVLYVVNRLRDFSCNMLITWDFIS